MYSAHVMYLRDRGGHTEAQHRHGPARLCPPAPRPPLTFCPSGAAACPWRRLGLPGPRCASGPPAPSAGCGRERPRRGNNDGGSAFRGRAGPGEQAGNAGDVRTPEGWWDLRAAFQGFPFAKNVFCMEFKICVFLVCWAMTEAPKKK